MYVNSMILHVVYNTVCLCTVFRQDFKALRGGFLIQGKFQSFLGGLYFHCIQFYIWVVRHCPLCRWVQLDHPPPGLGSSILKGGLKLAPPSLFQCTGCAHFSAAVSEPQGCALICARD